jgi:hypothetical protein
VIINAYSKLEDFAFKSTADDRKLAELSSRNAPPEEIKDAQIQALLSYLDYVEFGRGYTLQLSSFLRERGQNRAGDFLDAQAKILEKEVNDTKNILSSLTQSAVPKVTPAEPALNTQANPVNAEPSNEPNREQALLNLSQPSASENRQEGTQSAPNTGGSIQSSDTGNSSDVLTLLKDFSHEDILAAAFEQLKNQKQAQVSSNDEPVLG